MCVLEDARRDTNGEEIVKPGMNTRGQCVGKMGPRRILVSMFRLRGWVNI